MTASHGEPQATTYDSIPYDSQAFAHTHPDHLSTLAAIFGIDAPAPETARVLELGCASGGNLIPIAQSLPGAELVGVDLSERQIEDGRATLRATGIERISLQHRSILDIGPADGLFDYVICHGVYSWVPPEVQRKILAICRENMQPSGVAYISYNTLPGWHMRSMMREMMKFHAARFADPRSKIDQARALLDFLVAAVPKDSGAYAQLLHDELGIIQTHYDSYLFHEHLEEFNEPLYFHRFVARAGDAGLRYLCEAGFEGMTGAGLSAETSETLHAIAPDIIHLEQYMDFVRNRMFRRTLLVASDLMPDRTIDGARIQSLRLASALQLPAGGGDMTGTEPAVFRHLEKGTATIVHPVQKAALVHVHEHWPASVAFADVVAGAAERLGDDAPSEDVLVREVADLVLTCFPVGLLELHRHPPRFVTQPGERPALPALSRHLAAQHQPLTNLRHEVARVSELERRTAALLDGKRDRAAILDGIVATVLEEGVSMRRDGEPVTAPEEVRQLLAEALPGILDALGRKALLAE